MSRFQIQMSDTHSYAEVFVTTSLRVRLGLTGDTSDQDVEVFLTAEEAGDLGGALRKAAVEAFSERIDHPIATPGSHIVDPTTTEGTTS